MRRSFLVVFLYSSNAVLKIIWKLDENEAVVGIVWDIGPIVRSEFGLKRFGGRNSRAKRDNVSL